MRKLILAIILFSISFPAWSSTDKEQSENERDVGTQGAGGGELSETTQESHKPFSRGPKPSIRVKLAPYIAGKWVGKSQQSGLGYNEQMELDFEQDGEAVTGSAAQRSKFSNYKTTVTGHYVAATDSFVLKDLRFEYRHIKLLILTPILADRYDLHLTDNDSSLVGTYEAASGMVHGVFNLKRAAELTATPSEPAQKGNDTMANSSK